MSATGIDYQTFANLHAAVKANVTPEGLAENLIVPFRSWVGYALSDLQQQIVGYRDFNVIFYGKSDVEEFCNTSTFRGPQGNIVQIFAFKPGENCRRIHYNRMSPAAMECWIERQRCLCPASVPPSEAIYDSPNCNYVIYGEDACDTPYLTGEEDDCRFKSLPQSQRIFSVSPDYRIHVAPRFPCDYMLCLQWQGIKKIWADSDLVPIDNQLQCAVEEYVEHRMFMKEQQGAVSAYWEAYTTSIKMLRARFREEGEIISRDCSVAVDQLLPQFQALYSEDYGSSGTVGLRLVFTGESPPLTPDDPTMPAFWYPTGGGSLLQWDVDSMAWV